MRKVFVIAFINIIIITALVIVLFLVTYITTNFFHIQSTDIEKFYPIIISFSSVVISSSLVLTTKIKNEKVFINNVNRVRESTWVFTLSFDVHNDTSKRIKINKVFILGFICTSDKDYEIAPGETQTLELHYELKKKHAERISTSNKLDFFMIYSVYGKPRIRIKGTITKNPFYENVRNKQIKDYPLTLYITRKFLKRGEKKINENTGA